MKIDGNRSVKFLWLSISAILIAEIDILIDILIIEIENWNWNLIEIDILIDILIAEIDIFQSKLIISIVSIKTIDIINFDWKISKR